MTEEQVLSQKNFEIVGGREEDTDVLSEKSISFWGEVMRAFIRNKLAIVGIVILAIIAIMAIFVPILSPYDYAEQTGVYNSPPTADFWFGTDNLGRDVFVRSWVGARISLLIGISAAIINLVVGVVYGSVSGLIGGRVDNIMMRICDILNSVPELLIIILLLVVLQQGLVPMIIALSLTGWIRMARIVRAEVMSLKAQEYVLASRTLGASASHLIRRHLIPNAMGSIIVTMTLQIPAAIFNESFLSYIGLGVTPPLASWGTMASEGNEAILTAPWRLLFPALLISITIFGFNAVGDGLRDALDPKLRK
ncbi:ABC transporter permease [Ruoffia tabacinasalis]|jgi:oligopeptide transport system permease protein|uniref:ABC transporter permease n=1 Tax=Ruoffia tabacinasalis TaxID=87458 RepID=A0ABS0LJ85_9LACT|nr:ABC transporter permease [Ruoffia tabacinasalis]MBG9977504.1 ABC transporter permease [Ruoffia tabacinasalis]HJG48222.1 ABC transporter permease [Ruoffia tabacinasalis]